MSQRDCNTNIPGQPSRIPGNIGTLNSKVMIWEHDPFWARAQQVYSWSFSQKGEDQNENPTPNAVYEAGSAYLKPIYKQHDMFVCSINPLKASVSTFGPPDPTQAKIADGVDFVGATDSGVGSIAQSKMPGGKIFNCNGGGNTEKGTPEDPGPCFRRIARFVPRQGAAIDLVPDFDTDEGKDIFSHQVWKIAGNLFDPTVLMHPSEYDLTIGELQQRNNFSLGKLATAPIWDYISITNDGKNSIWPNMVTKSTEEFPVHWTLEKWTPLWQGEDFFITVKMKKTNDATDVDDGIGISTTIEAYKYLMYTDDSINFGGGHSKPEGWVQGISNEAFYIAPAKNDNGKITQEAEKESMRASRSLFDWRFNTYILIEVGVNSVDHRYFIEIVKGRSPRFLHLGDEWDNPNRLNEGVGSNQGSADSGFEFMRKCRVISVYESIISDDLFRQDEFRLTVRNFLGNIIITFDNLKTDPWIITRKDNIAFKTDFSKEPVPMVIPSAPVRIHGGNISAAINFSPLQYAPSETIPFLDRQIDSKQAKGKDLYITFSHIGNSAQYSNDSVKDTFFRDPRFDFTKIGYNCDAYMVTELNQNQFKDIFIYEEYNSQYRTYGKGYYLEVPRTERDWILQTDQDTQLPLPALSKNGMSDRNGGIPSSLEVINWSDPGFNFALELFENSPYPYKEFTAAWDVGIVLKAGSVKINVPTSLPIEAAGVKAHLFENYITPIVPNWRLIVLAGGKPFGKRFSGDDFSESGSPNAKSFDISPLVQKINDSWSSEDFSSLSHNAKLDCYIPIESTSGVNPMGIDNEQSNLFALGRKLIALHNKAFYVTISYWWDTGVGHRRVIGNKLDKPGDDPLDNDMLIQMTGVAYGAQLERSNNYLKMSFDVKDYMSILEKQFIFNSPFFDAVQDVKAIHELAKMASFDDTPGNGGSGVDRRPLGYLRHVLSDDNEERKFFFNGEESRSERYDLPGSYADLANPAVKFQNGETYESAMKRIAQLSGKVIYFDRWGVLRLETLPSIAAAFSSANDNLEFKPVFDFVTTPISRSTNVPPSGDGSQTNDFSFDPKEHAAHLVYNVVTYQRSVEDCVNQIVLLTASNNILQKDGTKTGGFVVEGYTFFDQIWNPEVEGFLGFRKPFYQSNGIFGGDEGLRNGIRQYAKMKYPPVIINFETYGIPGLKALDLISLDGNLAYIREISHDIDAATNRWWCSISAEWLKPFKGELGFLEAPEPSSGDI